MKTNNNQEQELFRPNIEPPAPSRDLTPLAEPREKDRTCPQPEKEELKEWAGKFPKPGSRLPDEVKDEILKLIAERTPTPTVDITPEPARKTLGDFMLAALTGYCGNGSVTSNNGYQAVANYAYTQAKHSFELYEKEGRP